MESFFIRLLIYHLLGDFYFQSNKIAYLKKFNFISDKDNSSNNKYSCRYLIIHVIIYILPFFILFAFLKPFIAGIVIAVNIVLHFIIDYMTGFCNRKNLNQFLVLIFDQLLHLLILYITYIVCNKYFEYFIDFYFDYKALKFILSILFLIKPSYIFVDKLLLSIKFKKDNKTDETNKDVVIADEEIVEENNEVIIEKEKNKFDPGKVIGIIERLVMFILLIFEAFTSLALIVTFKTWARSSDLKGDNNFRNKYLVGTFMSFLLALIAYFIYIY